MGRGISRGGCRLNESLSSLSADEWGCVPALLVVLSEASQQQSLQAVVVIVELLSHVWLFATPWTAAHQASVSFTISWSMLKLRPIELMMHPTISFSYPQSFPASGSFQMSQLFASGGQSIGVSASTSVLSNEHLGLISFRMDWLDLLAVEGTSRVLSNTTIQKHKFFSAQLSL